MEPFPVKRSAYLSSLRLLYSAFLGGVAIFLAVSLLLHVISGAFADPLPTAIAAVPETAVVLAVAAFAAAGHAGGRALATARLRAAQASGGLHQKLAAFRGALVLRAALMEGPVLFAVIGFLLTGFTGLAAVAGAGLLGMALFFPTKARVMRELALSYDEQTAWEAGEASP